MICPDCQKGMVFVMRGPNQEQQARPYGGEMFLENPEKYFDKIPCQRCNGSGIAYCCDGEDYNAECYSNGDNNVGSTSIRRSRAMVQGGCKTSSWQGNRFYRAFGYIKL